MKPKTVEDYLALPYTIELIREPEVGVYARVVELPGCSTQGDNEKEALRMIREAMRLWIEVALEDGVHIPLPRNRSSFSGRISLRMPPRLHEQLAKEAEREGVSLNQFIVTTLQAAVSSREATRLATTVLTTMFRTLAPQASSENINIVVKSEAREGTGRVSSMTSWRPN